MENIVDYYQRNYNEESRLSTNKARMVEFYTTIRTLENFIAPNSSILDVGAGTGIYSLYLAEKGHLVTATDITPLHVDTIRKKVNEHKGNIRLEASVVDGRDLSRYKSESFDVVLCLGPLYHLISLNDRLKCISECLRVLKEDGMLFVAYINRHFVITRIIKDNKDYLNEKWIDKIIKDGFIKSDENDCFWTDAYFHTPDEIEEFMNEHFGIKMIENIAADGISTLMPDVIDNMNDEEYQVWLRYHFKTCREPSILGYSNHGLYVGRKL